MAKFLTEEEEELAASGVDLDGEITPEDTRNPDFQGVIGTMNRAFLEREEESRRQMSARTEQGAFAETGDAGMRSWQEMANRQKLNAESKIYDTNAAYRQQMTGFNDKINAEAQAVQQKKDLAYFSSGDIALSQKTGVPLGMIPVFDNELGGTGAYAGGVWRGSGRDMKFVSLRKDRNNNITVDSVMPVAEFYKRSQKYPGILSDEVGEELYRQIGTFMTERQMQEAGINPPATTGWYGTQTTPDGTGTTTGDRWRIRDTFARQVGKLAQRMPENARGLNVVGTTSISGSLTNRLLGRPQERSSISAVGFDGKGRKGVYEANAGTGNRLVSHDEDMHGKEYKGRWKQTSVGPSDTFNGKDDKSQVRVYENTETGEVVRVKDGERMPWEKDLKMADASKKGISAQDRLAEIELKEKGKNERTAIQEEGKNKRAHDALEYKKVLDESLKQMKLDVEQDRNFRSIFGSITRQEGAVGAKFTPQEAIEQTKAIMSDMGHKISGSQAAPEKKDNGVDGSSVQYKQGDEQEINGVKMRLEPSSKDPNKLVWKRI